MLSTKNSHFRTKDTQRLIVKVWKKILHANGKEKLARIKILISNKIDFKTKAIVRDKKGHYIMIKGTIPQKDIIIVNIYTPNVEALKYLGKTNYDRPRGRG